MREYTHDEDGSGEERGKRPCANPFYGEKERGRDPVS